MVDKFAKYTNTRDAVVYLYVFAVRYILSCDMNCHIGEVVSRILQSYKQITELKGLSHEMDLAFDEMYG
jgi:hypothetical protein